MTMGEKGILTQAMKASFYQEMVGVKEIADFNNTSDFVNKQGNISNESIWTDTVSVEDIKAFPKTLKAEIIYTRENYDTDNANTYTTKEVWRRDLYEVRKTFSDEERLNSLSQELYYINGENLKKNKAYIYDSMTDVCYKIEPTVISAYTLHSIEYAKFILDNVMDKVSIATISTQSGIVTATDGTKYYEPNLNNFSYKTKLVYYMKDVLQDINIIDFAIISTNIEYKTNVYNKMVDKYVFELDSVGYTKAFEIENISFSNLSNESLIRNYLSMLRRWIIRSSGYMCIRKMAEVNTVSKVDDYMKKYSIGEEVVDSNTLKQRLEYIDDEILSMLRGEREWNN